MLDSLDHGLKATSSIVEAVEKIVSRILGISDRRKKKAELNRLIELLNATRISRTLNQGLLYYLKDAIEERKQDPNSEEIQIAADQIKESITAIVSIIDEMAEQKDRVAIYENSAWNELYSVVAGRSRLIDELQQIDTTEGDWDRLVSVANRYETFTMRLEQISFELSRYGRQLDSG